MAIKFNVNNSVKEPKAVYTSVNGVKRKIVKILTSVNGVIKVLYEDREGLKTGYLYISDANNKNLVFTDDYFHTFTTYTFDTNIIQLLRVGDTLYAYASATVVYTSTNITDWEKQTITLNKGSLTQSFSIETSAGVRYFNNKFYRIYYYATTGTSQGYGRRYYLAYSTDGIAFTLFTATMLTSILNYSSSITTAVVSSWGFLVNSTNKRLIFTEGYQQSSSNTGRVTCYSFNFDDETIEGKTKTKLLEISNLGSSNFASRRFYQWLTDGNANEVYLPEGNGKSCNYYLNRLVLNSDGTITNTTVNKLSNIAYNVFHIVNSKAYCYSDSLKEVCVVTSPGTTSATVSKTLSAPNGYYAPLVDNDGNIVLFGNVNSGIYKIDTTNDTITDLGTVAYRPKALSQEHLQTYLSIKED